MIAHAITSDSFRALCAYLCQESKNAEVLGAEGVRTDSAQHMAEDFTFQQQLRPTLGKAVFHIALSLRSEDAEGRSPEEVSMLLKEAAQAYKEELAKEIGPLKTQSLLVQHFDRSHPHAHLVLNRVDNHGKVIPDSFIGEHSRRACQRVEQQLGLATAEEQGRQQARREGPTNRQMAADTPRKVRIAGWQRARHTVANALQPEAGSSGNFVELADKLAPQRIKQVVSEYRQKDGSTRYGVRYEYDGHRFKGGEVGQQFTAPKLLEGFAQVQAERQSRQVDQQLEARENERVRQQAQQALTGFVDSKAFASHAEFREQVAAQGYTFVTGPAGEAQLRHEASARQFDLAQVQPGGPAARPLWEQVEVVVLEKAAEELAQQAARREAARQETEQAFMQTRDSGLSRPDQFFYRLRAQPYDLISDPQTRQLTHVRHRGSGEVFACAEVQPGGPGAPPLAEQLATACRAGQQQATSRQQLAAGTSWAQDRAQVEGAIAQVRQEGHFFNRKELQNCLQTAGVTLLPPSADGHPELFRLEATGQLFREKEVLRSGSVADLLTEAAERRATRRQAAGEQTRRDVQQTLHAPDSPFNSVKTYQQQLEACGYELRQLPGQPMKIKHLASGERFELTEIQPGGPATAPLIDQVRAEVAQQKQQLETQTQATKVLEQVLAAESYFSWPHCNAQVQAQGYQFVTGLDGEVRLLHEASRQHVALVELRPNGRDLASQVNESLAARQADLVQGYLEVQPTARWSAADGAASIQQQLAARGAWVESTPEPAPGGGVGLLYTHLVKGARLDEVNEWLGTISLVQGVTVREQPKGASQSPAEWPVRHGEYGQATLLCTRQAYQDAASQGISVATQLTRTGATVQEVPGAPTGMLQLEVRYHTQRTDVPALSGLLDQWASEGPNFHVRETERARQARDGQLPQAEKTYEHGR